MPLGSAWARLHRSASWPTGRLVDFPKENPGVIEPLGPQLCTTYFNPHWISGGAAVAAHT